MSHLQQIRLLAFEKRNDILEQLQLDPADLISAENIVEKSANVLDLTLIPEHPNSAHLRNSLAVLEDDVIYFDNTLDKWFQNYCIVHEFGHFLLHHAATQCPEEYFEDLDDEGELPSAASLVSGYGPNERREREANLFAVEFLLPCSLLRDAFLNKKMNGREIAKASGMPVSMVYRQLALALLVEKQAPAKEKKHVQFDLNPSQNKAAETDKCPVLISAGPGTGKTQTLVHRIKYLLKSGIPPEKILALTFSNKATNEMRERVSIDHPEAARKMSIMTFHSFGFEILRKYWEEAGLSPKPKLLDSIDSILHLEENVSKLDLKHYLNLREPAINIPSILSAISSAKDELCTPEGYLKLGRSMLENAENEEERITAEKVLETAGVYDFYQNYLEENDALDFGDLIFKSVRLLETNESVRRSVQSQFSAILVDEFQDVNRASGVLLRLVAGDGKVLWTVGDLRQSIYRWRGASPVNIRHFEKEYEGAARMSLDKNYRSKKPIVDLFSAFAGTMQVQESSNEWSAEREGKPGEKNVTMTEADSIEAEALAIANRIRDRKAAGVNFMDQALICRTHLQLARFAEELGKQDIPVLYLGKLFEREEIRDLLSLLEVRSSMSSHALLRVAGFPEYDIEPADIEIILSHLENAQISSGGKLEIPDLNGQITGNGQESWDRLVSHLDLEDSDISAARFLSSYLFSASKFLNELLSDQSTIGKQKLIAVYQFLQLAESVESKFRPEANKQISEFLNHVRRLARFKEQTNLAQIPPAAENYDAVRLITVHGAKGLEFDTVFLPSLANGKFPSGKQGSKCPTPVGLAAYDPDYHLEEEECLFFVSLSRAKDHLNLSRSVMQGGRNSSPSPFLTRLEDSIPIPEIAPPIIEAGPASEVSTSTDNRKTFYSQELNKYDRCPRQFYYYHFKGLKGRDDASPYQKFHRSLYGTIRELNSLKMRGESVNYERANEILNKIWGAEDLDSHAYSDLYRKQADDILKNIADRIDQTEVESVKPDLVLTLANGSLTVSPDAVEINAGLGPKQVILKRFKTGKSPKTITPENDEVAILKAAKEKYQTEDCTVKRIYLSDDTEHEVKITDRVQQNRIVKFESMIDSINARDFPAKPSDRTCPNCQYYFMCPSGG